MFFDGHERENVVEYRKTFLKEIKLLLSYFIEFQDDSTFLPKEYPKNFTVNGPNQQLIIIITYDESIFLANNSRQKVLTLERHDILSLKRKDKDIMVPNFLLP